MATYYVGPAATGTGSGADRSNLMALATFRDTTSAPGDIGLLQPGSYGLLTLNPATGTNIGTAGNHITYRADSGTCTARSSDWFTRTTALETADPDIHPVCTGVIFKAYRKTIPASPNEYGDADSYYITLDGLWSTAEITFEYSVEDVTITNCNVAVAVTQYLSTSADYCIDLIYYYGHGSDFANITIGSCYLYGGKRTVSCQGQYTGPIYVTDCRITRSPKTFITWMPAATSSGHYLYVSGCHVDTYVKSAYDTTPQTRTITAVDGSEPRRKFTVSADVSATYVDFVDFTHGGTAHQEIKLVGTANFDHGTYQVTLPDVVTFDFAVGVDTASFYDDGHGAGINISGDYLSVDKCVFHNLGDTAGFYIYKNIGSTGAHDITITNSLFYSCLNTIWGWSLGGTYDDCGDNITVKGNTFIGLYDSSIDSARPHCHYGRCLNIEANAAADTSTWNISNNIVVGLLEGHLYDAVRCGNIVYAHGAVTPYGSGYGELLDAGDPTNTDNLVIYAGEPLGSEPEPFDKAGTYFIANDANFDNVLSTSGWTDPNHGDWFNFYFNYQFFIKATSPARGAGNDTYATATDLLGTTRASPPSVGAYEYAGTTGQALSGSISELATVGAGMTEKEALKTSLASTSTATGMIAEKHSLTASI